MKKIKKIDGMLAATFLMTMICSSTWPRINKEIITVIPDKWVAVSQMINCASIAIWSWVWNRSKKIFNLYTKICLLETILTTVSTILALTMRSMIYYYVMDLLTVSVVTRNIICGKTRLKCIRYKRKEERESFDNNENSLIAIATMIGSALAIIMDFDFDVMLILATIGNAIDNVFYIFIYRNSVAVKIRDEINFERMLKNEKK